MFTEGYNAKLCFEASIFPMSPSKAASDPFLALHSITLDLTVQDNGLEVNQPRRNTSTKSYIFSVILTEMTEFQGPRGSAPLHHGVEPLREILCCDQRCSTSETSSYMT